MSRFSPLCLILHNQKNPFMLSFDQAKEVIMNSAFCMGTEKVDLLSSLNRVLAEDVFSDMDMPPFNKSAMDGYACKMADLELPLEIVEIIPAGKFPNKTISKGKCAKIMTGAPVPEGADCVIMFEDTEILTDHTVRFKGGKTKTNIITKATDICKDQLIIKKGTLIKSAHIAVLAGCGKISIDVFRQPKVGIISTGDELVEPFEIPSISGIRNTNAWQLIAQATEMNVLPKYYGIARDDEESLAYMISLSLAENDISILSGGVSKGEYDYVPAVLEKAGVIIHFDSISVQPGKPSTFGSKGKQLVFGLPGNPVSTFFQFELLVKPLLLAMMGYTEEFLFTKLEIGEDYHRKKSERLSFIPIRLKADGKVYPIEYHGSAHINALMEANGIMAVQPGESFISKGSKADVRLL